MFPLEMVIFNSYVKLPEGMDLYGHVMAIGAVQHGQDFLRNHLWHFEGQFLVVDHGRPMSICLHTVLDVLPRWYLIISHQYIYVYIIIYICIYLCEYGHCTFVLYDFFTFFLTRYFCCWPLTSCPSSGPLTSPQPHRLQGIPATSFSWTPRWPQRSPGIWKPQPGFGGWNLQVE